MEEFMKTMKKIGLFLLDFVEVWVPTICIAVIFGSFIVNVVSRYLFNSPVNACYELCLIGLLWALLLSAPHAIRTHRNVAFTLIYDKFGAWGQLIFRLVGTAFLLFCLIRMFYPCLDWVLFMKRKKTAVLKIRYHIIYFPFVIFNFEARTPTVMKSLYGNPEATEDTSAGMSTPLIAETKSLTGMLEKR